MSKFIIPKFRRVMRQVCPLLKALYIITLRSAQNNGSRGFYILTTDNSIFVPIKMGVG